MASKGKSSKQKPKAKTEDGNNANRTPVTSGGELSTEDMLEQFERELNWCIDQLELGLETQKPDSKRAQEAVKVLKILTSTKAPMIKKRQAMRNTFGDYRKKMEEEEKKSAAIAKKIKLTSIEKSEMQKSKYIQKSSSKKSSSMLSQTGSGDAVKGDSDINDSFKFNFSISDETGTSESKECSQKDQLQEKSDSNNKEGMAQSKSFTFVKSDNDFKFGFMLSDET